MPPTEIWVNGLVLSCIYMTMASGLVLIFSITRLLNWSHGQIYMVGAYVAYFSFVSLGIPFLLSLMLSGLVMFGIGISLHLLILRPIAQSVGRQVLGPVFVGVATIALSMLLEGAATLFFGAFPRGMTSPFKGVFKIAQAGISYQQIFVVVFTIILFALMYLVLNKTRAGLATRATAQDRHTAGLYGIKVSRVAILVMGIGCSLAALAGSIVTPLFSIDPFIGSQALFMTVLAIVIGGLGSLVGAILGGLILGFLGSVVSYYITYFYEISLFGLVILVLLFRPQGLFGQADAGQASGSPGQSPPMNLVALSPGKHAKKVVAFLVAAIFCIPAITTNNFILSLFISAAVWSIATMGFGLILRTGQFSLGQAGMMGLGAYISGILGSRLAISFWFSLPLAGIMAAFICFLVGSVVLRIGGIYFAVITFSMAEIIRILATQWDSITGGYLGIAPPSPAPISLFGMTLNFMTSAIPYYYLGIILLVLSGLVYWRIDTSNLGRIFRSIAVNPVLAEHQGIQLMKYRVIAYTVAGFFTGLAGAFYGNYLHYVGPLSFGFSQSTMITAMAFVGGISSIVSGPVIGATLLSLIATYATFTGISGLQPLVFGSVVVAFLLLLKGKGLEDLLSIITHKFRAKA
jgi:branched-chain amino acid transport system permease protein